MRTWVITAPSGPLYDRGQGSRPNTALPPKILSPCLHPCHICTLVPCFPNATKATQFSGSRHFQICLPAPSSSCLFLPTTTRLALIVRSCVPSISVCGVSAIASITAFRSMLRYFHFDCCRSEYQYCYIHLALLLFVVSPNILGALDRIGILLCSFMQKYALETAL